MRSLSSIVYLALFDVAFASDTNPACSQFSPAFHPCPSSCGFFVAVLSHPLELLLALLLFMLSVSPLTRSHISDLCFDFSNKLLCHYRLVQGQIAGDRQFKEALTLGNTKLRVELEKTRAHLTIERNRVVQLEREMKRKKTFFNALQGPKELHRIIESQSDEMKRLKENITDLNVTIDSKIAFHHAEVTDLESDIKKLEAAHRINQKRLADSRQENITLRDEIDRLKAQLSTKTVQHQATLVKLRNDHIQEIQPYKSAIKTLFKLSESTGDDLTTATIFADALKRNGINLSYLGIDERRARLLCEFVRRGQSTWDLVQPQATVLGFSLNPPKAPLPSTFPAPTLNLLQANRAPAVPTVVVNQPQSQQNFLSFKDLLRKRQQQQVQQQQHQDQHQQYQQYQKSHQYQQQEQQRDKQQCQQQDSSPVFIEPAPALVPVLIPDPAPAPKPAPFSLWTAQQQLSPYSTLPMVGMPLADAKSEPLAKVKPKAAAQPVADIINNHMSMKKKRQWW